MIPCGNRGTRLQGKSGETSTLVFPVQIISQVQFVAVDFLSVDPHLDHWRVRRLDLDVVAVGPSAFNVRFQAVQLLVPSTLEA